MYVVREREEVGGIIVAERQKEDFSVDNRVVVEVPGKCEGKPLESCGGQVVVKNEKGVAGEQGGRRAGEKESGVVEFTGEASPSGKNLVEETEPRAIAKPQQLGDGKSEEGVEDIDKRRTLRILAGGILSALSSVLGGSVDLTLESEDGEKAEIASSVRTPNFSEEEILIRAGSPGSNEETLFAPEKFYLPIPQEGINFQENPDLAWQVLVENTLFEVMPGQTISQIVEQINQMVGAIPGTSITPITPEELLSANGLKEIKPGNLLKISRAQELMTLKACLDDSYYFDLSNSKPFEVQIYEQVENRTPRKTITFTSPSDNLMNCVEVASLLGIDFNRVRKSEDGKFIIDVENGLPFLGDLKKRWAFFPVTDVDVSYWAVESWPLSSIPLVQDTVGIVGIQKIPSWQLFLDRYQLVDILRVLPEGEVVNLGNEEGNKITARIHRVMVEVKMVIDFSSQWIPAGFLVENQSYLEKTT